MNLRSIDSQRSLLDCAVSVVLLLGILVSCGNSDHAERVEDHKRLAAELKNNRLFEAAIEEYQMALESSSLSDQERASINYLIARVCYENIRDYENAAAYYVRAREYDPEGSFMGEASKNLVASLEKLGNLVDASRQLSAATDLVDQQADSGDVIVASIGGRSVWLSEINEHITDLPPEMQKKLLTPEAKREFTHQYVGIELLYNAALRENYLSDPEIQKQQERLVKRLVVDRYVVNKVIPNIKVDTSDVRNFYVANKEARYGNKPYDSVRAEVLMDYQTEKAEAAYGDYIGRLAEVENVEFYDHRVK